MARSLPVYTTLNIESEVPHASHLNLQWSSEGQLLLLTRHTIYILTPEMGVLYNAGKIISGLTQATATDDASLAPGWFKTGIEFQRNTIWASDSKNNWGTVVFGSLDVFWREAAWSPSNLNSFAGCLLAGLNSNLEVGLWAPVKNYLTGEWVKIQDITETLRSMNNPVKEANGEALAEGDEYLDPDVVLASQVLCIAWSKQCDYGLVFSEMLDGSLLALGTRAGAVLLMRWNGSDTVGLLETIKVSTEWITHLAWSNWTNPEPGQCQVHLICSSAGGAVHNIAVIQKLSSLSPDLETVPTQEIRYETQEVEPATRERRQVSALACVHTRRSEAILVFTKPGTVHIRSVSTADFNWDLRLSTIRLSRAASSILPACGILYDRRRDSIVVGLLDGSMHVIHNASTSPTLSLRASEDDPVSTESLSRTARSTFTTIEGRQVNQQDMMRMSTLGTYGTSGILMWIHEAIRPEDFNFLADAQHKSVMVMKEMWKDAEDLIEDIKSRLDHPISVLQSSPLHALQGPLLRLRRIDAIQDNQDRLLELFAQDPDATAAMELDTPQENTPLEVARRRFREGFMTDVLLSDSVQKKRLKFGLANFCARQNLNEEAKASFRSIANSITQSIMQDLFESILRRLNETAAHLGDPEIQFAKRLISISVIIYNPTDGLRAAANTLSSRLNIPLLKAPRAPNPSTGVADSATALSVTTLLDESCPACREIVMMNDVGVAKCVKGHIWSRCSVTTAMLATASVRTCIGCSRKTFAGGEGDSWVVKELLQAARCCLYCGNRFIQVL